MVASHFFSSLLEALRNSGLSPSDSIIVGFDGTDTARAAVIDGLLDATVAQEPYRMGRRAVEILEELLDGAEFDNRDEELDPVLVTN